MHAKLFVFAAVLALTNAHGYLKEPIARTSIQLRPEFNTQQPYWWDNSGVWCANVQQDTSYSQCGRCGDRLGETTANQGGIYDKGVTVATYQAGSVSTYSIQEFKRVQESYFSFSVRVLTLCLIFQIVEMVSDFQAAHYGHFELEICPQETETDGCFQKLHIVSASEAVRDNNRVCVPYDNNAPGPITARVQLPTGVTCNRCTIRWTYRTSYPGRPDWDNCDNPTPTQTFRNCADVKIQ
jgi:hypothetical protein